MRFAFFNRIPPLIFKGIGYLCKIKPETNKKMGKKQPDKLFLLGGYDLEMMTIKQMLEGRDDCVVIDKKLSWDNSLLSAYQEELSKYSDCRIYGIELKEDIIAPNNYTPFDHHNEKSREPSSLEQVAKLLDLKLNRYQQLVAANDKGYIPAMKALKASKEEIDDIRRKDRTAQGVTEDDEQKAKLVVEAADRSYPGLIIAKAANSKFSPIVDRLSEAYPYHSYIVYTDNAICTYGSIASSFKAYFHDLEGLYSGGIGDGYAGLSDIKGFSMEQIIKQIKNMSPISKHIFLFPFKYTKGQKLDGNSSWNGDWKSMNEKDKADLFNEKQYFYPFVRKALYDSGLGDTLLRHYERNVDGGKYAITVNQREYTLDIESINVNLYEFGLGILSIHLQNTDTNQASPEDILKINQFGRRVMPPFYKDITNNPRIELADKIKITWKDGNYIEEDFDSKTFTTENTWKVGSVISKLLNPLKEVEPVIDDRMFTLCYYKNNEEMARIAENSPHNSDFSRIKINKRATCKDFWYKYVFVDGGDYATCHGDNMYSELLRKQTYSRWEHPLWGTEYGVSRYSLVALTTETAPPFLHDYFETIYARLTELVLCQRAALVLFSERVRELPKDGITESDLEKSEALSSEYIKFVNNFCYREITAQDQGIELYSLMKQTLNTDSYEAALREQIFQLHNRIMEIHNEKIERNSLWLNKLACLVIPVSIFVSLAGLGQLWQGGFSHLIAIIIYIVVVIASMIGTKLILWEINNINKSK